MDILNKYNAKFDSAMEEVGHQLRNVLNEYQRVSLMYAEVTAVDTEALTFDVIIDEENEMKGIPLAIVNDDSSSVVMVPEIGSICTLGFVQGNASMSFPIKFSKVQSISVQFEMLEDEQKQLLSMDKDGITYSNTTDNAKLDIIVGETSITMEDKLVKVNGGDSPMIYIEKLTQKLNEFVKTFNSHTHKLESLDASAPNGPVKLVSGEVGAPNSSAGDFSEDDYQDETFTH